MPAEALKCKECSTTYPLEARYVCERCFGPLEVAYAPPRADPAELKRRIQAGPHTLWRYADFLPLAGRAPRSSLPTGWTPLVRADRLAERLGLGEVWIKNETANPTHSFKDRVVSVALARALELGFDTVACASTGNLAGAVAAHAADAGPAGLRVRPRRPRAGEDPLGRRLRRAHRRRARQLRRREPALHRGLRGARGLGVRQRQRPAVLRGGLQDARVRDGGAARLGAARPRRRAGRVRARCSPRSRAASRSSSTRACSAASSPTMHGAQAEGCSPVAQAFAAGHRRLPPGQAGHDRQVAGDRQPGRRAVRGRARAAAPAAPSTRSPTTRSAPASGCSPRRPASSPRPRAA